MDWIKDGFCEINIISHILSMNLYTPRSPRNQYEDLTVGWSSCYWPVLISPPCGRLHTPLIRAFVVGIHLGMVRRSLLIVPDECIPEWFRFVDMEPLPGGVHSVQLGCSPQLAQSSYQNMGHARPSIRNAKTRSSNRGIYSYCSFVGSKHKGKEQQKESPQLLFLCQRQLPPWPVNRAEFIGLPVSKRYFVSNFLHLRGYALSMVYIFLSE